MDRSLYIAMNAAGQTLLAQQVEINNLSNVNTNGFKSDFNALTAQYLQGPGYNSRAYTEADVLTSDLSSGGMISTGRELDVAIQGAGWLAVQTPDGNEAYTRAGNLSVTATGQLVTADKRVVMGNGGPISIPPNEKIEIGRDGTISVRPLGQSAATLAQIDRIKLVNPDEKLLEKTSDGLFRLRDGSTASPDAKVQLVSGMLEGSNVNSVGAMTDIISLARQFEIQLKMMRNAEENAQVSARIMQMD